MDTKGNKSKEEDQSGLSRFRFEATWLMEDSCENVIDKSWKEATGSVPEKLMVVGDALRNWSKNIHHDRKAKQQMLEEELARLDDMDLTDEVLLDTIQRKLELNMEVDRQEVFWEQRAHANWKVAGERNMSFYHKFASQRKRKNKTVGLEDSNGTWKDKASKIVDIASSYFQNIYTSQGVCDNSYITQRVKRKLSGDANGMLLKEYTKDEVWEAVKGMDPLKASGHDGFPALFSKKFCMLLERK